MAQPASILSDDNLTGAWMVSNVHRELLVADESFVVFLCRSSLV